MEERISVYYSWNFLNFGVSFSSVKAYFYSFKVFTPF